MRKSDEQEKQKSTAKTNRTRTQELKTKAVMTDNERADAIRAYIAGIERIKKLTQKARTNTIASWTESPYD